MTYDSWKATNAADEWLGPEPDNEDNILARIITRYDAKPIPDRRFDWTAVMGDYDLGHPVGYGLTEVEAINDLIMQIEGVRR